MNVFNAAIKSHEQWKVLLKRHIDLGNILDPHEVVNCHACELGKWIYGAGLRLTGYLHLKRYVLIIRFFTGQPQKWLGTVMLATK